MRHRCNESLKAEPLNTDEALLPDHTHPFAKALGKIATADEASSRAAIEAAKATKPSLHTRFVHDPVRGRA